jgi:hypothetical protein
MQIKCTSCGATQELTSNQQCGYCGSAIEQEKAQENYKTATTGEIGNLMMMAETAIDATNWEEALQFYNQVLTKEITNSDAWLGKGIAIVYTSKIGDIKTKEAIAYWKNALKHAENNEAMGKRVAKEINLAISSFYPIIQNHFIQFKDLEDSYIELFSKFLSLENALNYANKIDSTNLISLENGYNLCESVEKLLQVSIKIAEREGKLPILSGSSAYDLQEFNEKRNNALAAISRKSKIEDKLKETLEIKNRYKKNILILKPDHELLLEKNLNYENELQIDENEDEKLANLKEENKKYGLYLFWGVVLGVVSGSFIVILFSDFFKSIAEIFGPVVTTLFVCCISGFIGAKIGLKLHKNNIDNSNEAKKPSF